MSIRAALHRASRASSTPRRPPRGRGCRERGQALPILLAILAVAAALALGLARVGVAASHRAAAQATADAVALAGAAEGRIAADSIARDEGAAIIEYRGAGEDVWVVIQRDGVRARAHAGPAGRASAP